jgi:hypothetical protein
MCPKSNYSGGFSISSAPGGREKATFFCPHVETLVREVEACSIKKQWLFVSSSIK